MADGILARLLALAGLAALALPKLIKLARWGASAPVAPWEVGR